MEIQTLAYNGKHYQLPILDPENPFIYQPKKIPLDYDKKSLVIRDLNTPWNMQKFKIPRILISLGIFPEENQKEFSVSGAVRVLDMPIKFPGTEYRIPRELQQFTKAIQWIADSEETINSEHARYYCYLTIDQDFVQQGTLMREAPCHVDGFQGVRWPESLWVNHTYTLEDALPTVYYPQPFNLDILDTKKHDFFWEFNRQVAMTNSHYAQRFSPFELTLMNAYCVHRGDEAPQDLHRTWMRMSYEVRLFDRLGNAHNPLFNYDWKMVERDIEQLGLVAYDQKCDPSLRVFPWQGIDGKPNPPGVKTKPNLRPQS